MSLRPITLIGIVVSMVTGIGLGIGGYGAWMEHEGADRHTRTFDEALRQVHESYVSPVEKDALVKAALKGMLHDLDSHSEYLDSLDYQHLQEETSGQFGGIGIELGLVDGYFTVVAPLDETPASAAGLQAGDRITDIDDQPLRGKQITDVVDMLRGQPGTPITLDIERDGQPVSDIAMIRRIIEVASVRGELLEPGYGYIRISQFQTATSDDFTDAVSELIRQAGGELKGLVLDLRNNPGGVLQSSVAVADTFLENGLIVYTEGRLPSSHLKYRASGHDALHGAPLVVLINGGSASAAEVVAGALQDHHRATLLGSKSYGKGSVQSVVPLSGERAIKLTTAYYYTPTGRSIHNIGIEPDVRFDPDPEQAGDDVAVEDLLLSKAVNLLKDQSPTLQARL